MPAIKASDAPEWAKDLTTLQRGFVEEYLVDLNGTKAHCRARGVEVPPYTSDAYKSARAGASRLLARPDVSAAIETLLQERGVTRVWIIDQYARMARVDVTDFVNADGTLTVASFADLDPELRLMISGVEPIFDAKGNQQGVKLTFHNDRKAALDKLSKVLRMEVTRTEVSGPNGGAIEVSDPADDIMAQLDLIQKRNEERERAVEGGEVRSPPA